MDSAIAVRTVHQGRAGVINNVGFSVMHLHNSIFECDSCTSKNFSELKNQELGAEAFQEQIYLDKCFSPITWFL